MKNVTKFELDRRVEALLDEYENQPHDCTDNWRIGNFPYPIDQHGELSFLCSLDWRHGSTVLEKFFPNANLRACVDCGEACDRMKGHMKGHIHACDEGLFV